MHFMMIKVTIICSPGLVNSWLKAAISIKARTFFYYKCKKSLWKKSEHQWQREWRKAKIGCNLWHSFFPGISTLSLIYKKNKTGKRHLGSINLSVFLLFPWSTSSAAGWSGCWSLTFWRRRRRCHRQRNSSTRNLRPGKRHPAILSWNAATIGEQETNNRIVLHYCYNGKLVKASNIWLRKNNGCFFFLKLPRVFLNTANNILNLTKTEYNG